mgnify:CR=1 FL=1
MTKFQQLRELLLGDERRALERQQAQIDALSDAHADLAQQLPALIEAAEQGPAKPALHQALSPAVAAALDDSVRRAPQRIVDALFPIIGPAIRKAIAEALRGFVLDINRAMEMSFTPRGLRWRFESWRSGVPFAQVVLKHTLSYCIDHLFLIEREAGILLYRYSAPELPDLDADAIAGMLTAIGDFVRDSVQAPGGGSLASATVGEHLLLVREGPRATLAAFVRGVPPAALHERLSQKLEDLHRGAAGDPGFDWPVEAARALDVTAALVVRGEEQRAPMPKWPWIALALFLAIGCSWLIWQRIESGREREQLQSIVAAEPGWRLIALDRNGAWQLKLLRDPDARSVTHLQQQFGGSVEVDEIAFLSLDDMPVARRAERTLALPATASVRVERGVLALSGEVDSAWTERYLPLASAIAGVRDVDTRALKIGPTARERLQALAEDLNRRALRFSRGGADVDEDQRSALVADVRRLVEMAQSLEVRIVATVTGHSDEGGSERRNRRLRAERAQILHDSLRAAGVGADQIVIAVDNPQALAPKATMHWEIR